MKKNILLSAMLIAVCGMFAGCAGEEDSQVKTDLTPKTLQLTIKGTESTRTAGANPTYGTDNEAKVNNLVIGIFTGDGASKVDNIMAVDAPNIITPITITYTTTTPKIVVVANAPKSTFTTATTYEGFIAKTLDLDNTTATYSSGTFTPATTTVDGQNSNVLPMYTTNVNIDEKAKTATASISRAVARVSIGSITADLTKNVTYSNYTMKVDEVFMYGARKTMNLEGTLSDDSYQGELATHVNPPLARLNYLGSGDISGAKYSNHYYYVFPTNADKELRLVIKATLTDKDDDKKTVTSYYPVVINLYQDGTTIKKGDNVLTTTQTGKVEANKTYDISAVIKNVGVASPDATIAPVNINLTVTVADWAENLTQNVIFN